MGENDPNEDREGSSPLPVRPSNMWAVVVTSDGKEHVGWIGFLESQFARLEVPALLELVLDRKCVDTEAKPLVIEMETMRFPPVPERVEFINVSSIVVIRPTHEGYVKWRLGEGRYGYRIAKRPLREEEKKGD